MRPPGAPILLLLAAALILPALVGCRAVPFVRKGQIPPIFPENAADQAVLSMAQKRLCSVQSYRCDAADVVYRSPKEKLACDATIRLRAPDAARIIGEKLAAGTIFDLLAQGGVVRNYVPRDKKVYVYSLAEGGGSVATVPWRLILGVRVCPAEGLPLRDAQIERAKSEIILKGISEDGAYHETLRFDAKTLLLKSCEILRIGRSGIIRADYADWTQIGDIWWPLHVLIHLPLPPDEKGKSAEATVELSQRLSKVKLNIPINDAVFNLDVPPGTPEEFVEAGE